MTCEALHDLTPQFSPVFQAIPLSPLAHFTPMAAASLLFLKHARHVPASVLFFFFNIFIGV